MIQLSDKKLIKQQIDLSSSKNVKGGGWGNGQTVNEKNCPPPFDPLGKHHGRIAD